MFNVLMKTLISVLFHFKFRSPFFKRDTFLHFQTIHIYCCLHKLMGLCGGVQMMVGGELLITERLLSRHRYCGK